VQRSGSAPLHSSWLDEVDADLSWEPRSRRRLGDDHPFVEVEAVPAAADIAAPLRGGGERGASRAPTRVDDVRGAPLRVVAAEPVQIGAPSIEAPSVGVHSVGVPAVDDDAGADDGSPVRRTITITGRGAERHLTGGVTRLPVRSRERRGRKPDRIAMWAVLLGIVLAIVAATSSHAAVLAHTAGLLGR